MANYLPYVVILLFTIYGIHCQGSPKHRSYGENIKNEYLVLLKNDGTNVNLQVSQIEDLFSEYSYAKGHVIKKLFIGRMHVLHIYAEDELMQELSSHPTVQHIEANKMISFDYRSGHSDLQGAYEYGGQQEKRNTAESTQSQTCIYQNTNSSIWGLSRISSTEKPDYNNGKYYYNENDGQGVEVYVIDSGINTDHVEFEGRAVRGFTASGLMESEGEDDLNGHGTHCAGTVGAKSYGVAKKAKLVAVKVMSRSGSGLTTDILEGLVWIYDDFTGKTIQNQGRKPKAVLSMSIGSPGEDIYKEFGVNILTQAGLPVVVAASNDDDDACKYSPGRVGSAITVGATNISDQLASFSNYGPCVDILAPGEDIKSTWIGSNHATTDLNGTSMACPHVSGAVAKLLSNMDIMPSPSHIKALLIDSATVEKIDVRDKFNTPNRLLFTGCIKVAPEVEPPVVEKSFSEATVIICSFLLVFVIIILIIVTTTMCYTTRAIEGLTTKMAKVRARFAGSTEMSDVNNLSNRA